MPYKHDVMARILTSFLPPNNHNTSSNIEDASRSASIDKIRGAKMLNLVIQMSVVQVQKNPARRRRQVHHPSTLAESP